MTWKFKVQRGAFVLAIVAGLAMAAGADWMGWGWGIVSNWMP
jgi:hypothetical protein